MTTLLRVDSSPRPDSLSRRLGDAFTTAWRRRHPEGRVTRRDLARDPVPFIDAGWAQLCDRLLAQGITDPRHYGRAVDSAAQRAAWDVVEPLLTRLLEADTVLITAPMHNYSIPATLKAWLDQVTFPRMSLAGKRFVVAMARGGAYSPGAPKQRFDHQERYLRDFLAGHFAVTDGEFVAVEFGNARVDPLLAGHVGDHAASVEAALAAAAELGGKP